MKKADFLADSLDRIDSSVVCDLTGGNWNRFGLQRASGDLVVIEPQMKYFEWLGGPYPQWHLAGV
jgi:hypothetical protein